jgi:hypothetical protein
VISASQWWRDRGQHLGGRWQLVCPRSHEEPPLPRYLEPELHPRFAAQRRFTTPEAFALEVPHGRVVGRHAAIIAPDDAILREISLEVVPDITGDRWPGLLGGFRLPTVQRWPGRIGVLTSLWSDGYYHWLFDVLPRLELLRRAGAEPERLVVSADLPFQRETLERVGVEPARWIAAGPKLHLEAETLAVPSLPGDMGTPPAWAHAFLRRALMPSADEEGRRRRIYVSRKNSARRRVVDEPRIAEVLAAHGFEPVFPEALSVAEQARLFHSASAVVAPHGAALSNLVFCRPGTPVVELFTPRYVATCYWIIAAYGGLRYGYVLGDAAPGRTDASADIVIPPARLRSALEAWGL